MQYIIFVTGASRGFGQSFVVEVSKSLTAQGCNVILALMSRTSQAGTVALVSAASPAAYCVCEAVDVSELSTLEASFKRLVAAASLHLLPSVPISTMLLNNAGTLGEANLLMNMSSYAEVSSSINMNVTSCIWLTSLYLKALKAHFCGGSSSSSSTPPSSAGASPAMASKDAIFHTVINVSSLCAIKSFVTQGLYCVGKAARLMLHSVIAAEGADIEASLGNAAKVRNWLVAFVFLCEWLCARLCWLHCWAGKGYLPLRSE
jgi:sepiapterin reductase